MAPRLRRMKTYRPRRRAKRIDVHKQNLQQLIHKMSADIGSLILLIREGTPVQVEHALQKAKSDFLKHGAEMQKTAQQMGNRFVRAVRDFLDSIDNVVHCNIALLDEAKIRNCFIMTDRLERELQAA